MADTEGYAVRPKRPNLSTRHSVGTAKRKNASNLQLAREHTQVQVRKNMSETSLKKNRSSGHLSRLSALNTSKVPSKKARKKKRNSIQSDRSNKTTTEESDGASEEEVDDGQWDADAGATLEQNNESDHERGLTQEPVQYNMIVDPPPSNDHHPEKLEQSTSIAESEELKPAIDGTGSLPTPPPSSSKSYEERMLSLLQRRISFDRPTTATDRTPAQSLGTPNSASSANLHSDMSHANSLPAKTASPVSATGIARHTPSNSMGFLDSGPRQTSTQQKLNMKRAEWSKEEDIRPHNQQSGLGAYVGFDWERLTEVQMHLAEQDVHKRVNNDYEAMLRSGRNPMAELIAEYQNRGRIPTGEKKEVRG